MKKDVSSIHNEMILHVMYLRQSIWFVQNISSIIMIICVEDSDSFSFWFCFGQITFLQMGSLVLPFNPSPWFSATEAETEVPHATARNRGYQNFPLLRLGVDQIQTFSVSPTAVNSAFLLSALPPHSTPLFPQSSSDIRSDVAYQWIRNLLMMLSHCGLILP